MAGIFAILLTFATLITGILWFFEKFKWKPERQRKVEEIRKQSNGEIDGKILSEVARSKFSIDAIASYFPVLFIVFVIRSFLYEPFQIPSGSMMPTLLIGDFIAVQKYSYGIRNPLTNGVIIPTGHPERGDIAVFKYPLDPSVDYVKRVIGLPGDKIIFNSESKELTIYPACEKEDTQCQGQQSQPLNLNYSDEMKSDWKELFTYSSANFYTTKQYNNMNIKSDNGNVFSLKNRKETENNITHDILLLPFKISNERDYYKQQGQKIGEWIVPQGQYFMMGDNRDNSADSRYWGFVPEENFVGKVSTIWISFEKQPNEWPTGIRFERIGSVH